MSQDDQSGRSSLSRNVVTSWLSYLVFVFFGFLMPRAVSDTIGQTALGVWDFGWAVVSYLSLTMVGIGTSVNRYVARFRASGEELKLSKITSSVVAVQSVIASAVLIATIVISRMIPSLLGDKLGDQSEVASIVVLYLGAALAVQMAFDAFRGILTGCHKWAIYNGLNAIGHSVAATSMLIVLSQGGGLQGMALAFLVATIFTECVRYWLAKRVCPEIDFRFEYVNKSDVLTVFRFGVKRILIGLPKIVILQTVNVLVLIHLGPAMLAVFARPLALITHVQTLVNKFAFVLTPAAGSLQGSGRDDELREFAIVMSRAGWILTVLPLSYLLLLGDSVVELWMGDSYSNWSVIAILAVGSLFPFAQNALLTILVGMDRHGHIAKASLIISTVVMIPGLIVVSYIGWSLEAAALLVVIPSNIGMATMTMVVGAREFGISGRQYFGRVLKDPLILLAACCSSLWLVRVFGPQELIANLVFGVVILAAIASWILRKDVRRLVRAF